MRETATRSVVTGLVVILSFISAVLIRPAPARASYPTIDRPLLALDFVSARIGWVAGSHRVIMRTTIGGDWWTRQSSQAGGGTRYTDVCFVDRLHGWVVGENGVPLRSTSDGGARWVAQGFGAAAPGLYADRIHFINRTTGWALFGSGQDGQGAPAFGLMRTLDAGQTWTTLAAGEGMAFGGVEFTDAARGWLVGRVLDIVPYVSQLGVAAILATADGGLTWARLALPPEVTSAAVGGAGLLDVDFADAGHGVAGGWVGHGPSRRGVLMATADGGATWSVTLSSRFTRFTRVSMATASVGWAVGEGGGRRILTTQNGGRTWSAQWLPVKTRAAAVDAVTAKAAFVCGTTTDGRHAMVARTRDGGLRWKRVR